MNQEELERELRACIEDRVNALPVTTLTREQSRTQLLRVRRRRVRARVAPAMAALAVAAVIGFVVGGGTFPGLRGLAPAPVVPGPDGRASKLVGQPTRGSLAGDRAFLSGMRRAVLGLPEQDRFGNRLTVASTQDVAVLFAGDVASYRVVLVEARYRGGPRPSYHQVWFDAARGSTPDALVAGDITFSGGSPRDVAWHWLPKLGPSSAAGTGGYVVLSALGGRPVVAHAPTYAADAAVHWQLDRPAPAGPGWWQGTLTWDGQVGTAGLIRLPGEAAWQPLAAGSGPDPGHPTGDGLPPVHGTGTPSGDRARYAYLAAQDASGLRTDRSVRRLLWSGTLNGWWVDVIAVGAPSGARIVTAVAQEPVTGPGSMGTFTRSRVLPAGPLDRVALAWAPLAPGSTATAGGPATSAGPTTPTGSTPAGSATTGAATPLVGLLGPVGAVRAELIARDGSHRTVPLTDGVGAVTADASRVVFTDGGGRPLAEVPVVTTDSAQLTPSAP